LWRAAVDGAVVEPSPQATPQALLGDGLPLSDRPAETYLLPLLAGDELAPDAIAELAATIKADCSCDLVYADHAERFAEGDALSPFFKPGWSPETLIANDYIARAAIRRDKLPQDSLWQEFDAVDLWSLWLDFARRSDAIVRRCERVLFRLAPADPGQVASQVTRAAGVVEAHLAALGVSAQAVWPDWARRLGVLAFDFEFPDEGPKVSILIPTKNNRAVFARCIESLSQTTYRNYEILVIDNASDDPATLAYLDTLRGKEGIRITRVPSLLGGFSYSYVNNVAAREADGEFLLFLNDDTEVIAPRWLSRMVGWGRLPGIASVGARLYFSSDQVQHCGLVHNLLDGVLPAPAFKLTGRTSIGAHAQDRIVRNYAAVTAACMLTPRGLFLDQGGFDDVDFSVAYNDCDYGFRLAQRGLRHVCVPTAELYHHEGVTRGRGRGNDKISEEVAFIQRYAQWVDPYYNRNLSRESFQFDPVGHTVMPAEMPDFPLTAALFSHNLNYEGAPLVLLDIARGLAQLGGIRVVVLSLVDGPLRSEFERAGCKVVVRPDIGVFGARSEADIDAALRPLADLLLQYGVDLVLANTVLTHWGVLAGQMAGLPTIWAIHESEPPFSHIEPYGPAHLAMARQAFSNSSQNVFVAMSTRALYRSLARQDNLRVIYNGFDSAHAFDELRRFDRREERGKLGVADGELLFVLPGTVCERKAQQDLVGAMPLLPNGGAGCRFVIVGDRDGHYSRELHAKVASLPEDLRRRIAIVGETPEVWRYYGAADCMVFTSHLESFPRVIQEAMYAGLAIVTTPVFGISEQLRDGQSGLFFEPGNVIDLAKAIGRVAADRPLRQMLGRNARISLGRFPTMVEMQEAYVSLVREVSLSPARGYDRRRNWLVSDEPDHAQWWSTLCAG
jgi:glycosyltransferase involved in cell wall biosynthesis/GT2 family glycosyltransferase